MEVPFNQVQKYYNLVSNSQTKTITGLRQKKYRDKQKLFVAEGPKVIRELYEEGFALKWYFSIDPSSISADNHFLVTESELRKLSFLQTPNAALAVFEIPERETYQDEGLVVALDAVRDPGNLGTIIRLCDWFGVRQLVCSEDTADCYNPKVVQASMGSLARVQVYSRDLSLFLDETQLPVYGGFMEGKNIYSEVLSTDAILVMGNESNGISEDISHKITHKMTIPRSGKIQKAESLNVATATAILLGEFRRVTGK